MQSASLKRNLGHLALAAVALVLAPQPVPGQGGPSALHCGKVYIGNGQVMTNVYLVIEDGKVQRLTRTRPADTRIIDAGDKVVIPGIVAADTDLGNARDNDYNVTPDFVALGGFDFVNDFDRALSGGVTTAYLSPGRQRFVSGQGSVVKLFGEDMVRRVLRENACLRITLGKEANVAPSLFEPTPHPTADDPLRPARKQFPSSRISQLNELRRVFRLAQTGDEVQGQGAAEDRYKVQPLRDAAAGKLALRIAAKEAPDIRNAIRFATELGARLVLESPYEIEKALAIHDGDPLSAVFRLPVRPGRSNLGGENRRDQGPRNLPEHAVLAAAKGTRIALATGSDADLQDFLLVAGIAIRMGLSPEQVLKAITLDAAKILGVDDRVGSLEPGKDADFLILSAEPFGVGTMVEETWVGGALAYHREKAAEVLVVKAGRIITLEGQTVENGAISVSGGKIRNISQDPTIPGARVIDMGDAVIVPGFVDAYCHAGLSGDGTGIPNGRASHRIAEVVRHDDPVLQQLLQAGLTTAFVSGRDSTPVSGRVAAIKTGASDKESMVLRDIAGIRLVHDNVTPGSVKSLESQIDRAKAYIAKWQKYEKDLADWKAGKKVEVKSAPPVEEKKPGVTDRISGTWNFETDMQRFPIGFLCVLKLADKKITGTAQLVFQGQPTGPEAEITEGTCEDGENFSFRAGIGFGRGGGSTRFEGKVDGDKLTGTVDMGRRNGPFTATRTSGAPVASSGGSTLRRGAKPKDGSPEKPPIDDDLEPMKALLEKKIPAIVNTTRAEAIQEVVESFESRKLPYVLFGARDAVDTPDILGSAKPAFLLTPAILSRVDGAVRNAAARVSEAGFPVGLASGDTEGSRYLPLHAALAVRYGMDPTEALKAITLYPARMFKLDHRIGSLKRGKDADFVVFSGHPLEMTSRVLMVVVNGKVVVDNRRAAGEGK